MNDYSELKRLAEACVDLLPLRYMESHGSLFIRNDHGIVFDVHQNRGFPAFMAANKVYADLVLAANPAAVLELIAENERLGGGSDLSYSVLLAERRQLKAEVESLRKDKDRLDAIEANYWDVRHLSSPIADTGDNSTSVEIVGHWMDKPWERVIGENYDENLRAALDQAMTADAYPPARPEYPEFDDIPEFGGGSGNKARRRAEALGVDYDAAMSKEAGHDR